LYPPDCPHSHTRTEWKTFGFYKLFHILLIVPEKPYLPTHNSSTNSSITLQWHWFSSPVEYNYTLEWSELRRYRPWNLNYTEPTMYRANGIDGVVKGFLEHFSYTVTGLQTNKYYTFRLTAVNAGGASEISNSAWMATGKNREIYKVYFLLKIFIVPL